MDVADPFVALIIAVAVDVLGDEIQSGILTYLHDGLVFFLVD